jgi:hypothetical protein
MKKFHTGFILISLYYRCKRQKDKGYPTNCGKEVFGGKLLAQTGSFRGSVLYFRNYSVVVKNIHFFVMAGGNEAQGSDRMELPTHSDDEYERHVFWQVEAVTALRFVSACHATE